MARRGLMRDKRRMSPYRFDHIHLRSPDPEATAAFYVAAFGAAIKARVQAAGALRVVLDLAGVPLFIEAVPPATPAPPAPPFLGIEHIGLTVEDLDVALADLAAQGVTLISGPTTPRPGVRIAFLAAPDGVRVELIERRG
jgi:catechol 2,3-dioxygenase-like lactoylglutathione lyase family enzyme